MKMRKTFVSLVTVILVLGLSISTHSALIDLGGGMIYSTDLNLTWLQDANYAQTSGYSSDGFMTWDEATTWATNLVYAGLSGWRLPTFDPADPDQCSASPQHEMLYLVKTELGNSFTNTTIDPPKICLSGGSAHNYGHFINVVTVGSVIDYDRYWSGTPGFYPDDPTLRAWEFYFT
jgi:hypothetical protein